MELSKSVYDIFTFFVDLSLRGRHSVKIPHFFFTSHQKELIFAVSRKISLAECPHVQLAAVAVEAVVGICSQKTPTHIRTCLYHRTSHQMTMSLTGVHLLGSDQHWINTILCNIYNNCPSKSIYMIPIPIFLIPEKCLPSAEVGQAPPYAGYPGL